MMKVCVSYRVVELMEQGRTPQEACVETLRYLLRKRPPEQHNFYGAALIAGRGWVVGNVDSVIVAEAPRLAPHVPEMRARLAAALAVELDAVSIKATRPERLGALGRGEGLAAMAVVLLGRRESS